MPAYGESLVTSENDLMLYRRRLEDARFSGVRTITDSNGESVTYRSQSEIERAIQAIDAELRSLRHPRRGVAYMQMSKGV